MSDRYMLKIILGYIYAEESKNHMGIGEYPDTFLYKMKRKIKCMLGEYEKRKYAKCPKCNHGDQN